MNRSRAKLLALLGALVALLATMVPSAAAHESPNDGHVPPNTNYGFQVIGRDTLTGIQDGLYTDVWSHNGYAYVGTFQEPTCSDAGVFVVDMAAAIANYPNTSGATVAEIKSPPDTRVNDVKVHTVGDIDVLIMTEEPCGAGLQGGQVSDFNRTKDCPQSSLNNNSGEGCNRNNGNGNQDELGRQQGAPLQKGRGGISLYDVTDPTKPKPLEKSFLDFRGVHNTFAWSDANGSYLLGVADTFDLQDLFIVDISDPRRPELILVTGLLDWANSGAFTNFDQLQTGTSGFLLLHDVWVENIDGRNMAVLSYWDAGFINLDVSDPYNPVFMGDSNYPNPDPLTGLSYEGNAHAAVYGGNGDYIFGGDEDFNPERSGVQFDGVAYQVGFASFGGDASNLTGPVIDTGGVGCDIADIAPATEEGQIALINRGGCFFSQKVYNAEVQGYVGAVIANNDGDGVLTMGPGPDPLPTIPSLFVGQSTGAIMAATPGGLLGGTVSLFDGWGYLHVLNNRFETVTVPDQFPGPDPTIDVGYLGEIGYYAPAELLDPTLGVSQGDLTMHNVEADPLTQSVVPSFDAGPRMFVSWYSLGMRALEYRPGHFHANLNGEGSYSWNVHEVGRFIAEDGSNFWGVHVDELNGEQIILGSDRNTGLWIFRFSCESEVDGVFYCQNPDPGPEAPPEGEAEADDGA